MRIRCDLGTDRLLRPRRGGGGVVFEGGRGNFFKRALFWGVIFYLVRKIRGVKF